MYVPGAKDVHSSLLWAQHTTKRKRQARHQSLSLLRKPVHGAMRVALPRAEDARRELLVVDRICGSVAHHVVSAAHAALIRSTDQGSAASPSRARCAAFVCACEGCACTHVHSRTHAHAHLHVWRTTRDPVAGVQLHARLSAKHLHHPATRGLGQPTRWHEQCVRWRARRNADFAIGRSVYPGAAGSDSSGEAEHSASMCLLSSSSSAPATTKQWSNPCTPPHATLSMLRATRRRSATGTSGGGCASAPISDAPGAHKVKVGAIHTPQLAGWDLGARVQLSRRTGVAMPAAGMGTWVSSTGR